MNARDPLLPVQPDEADALAQYASRVWDEEIVPRVTDYIAIPAKSPMFDADWAANGHIDKVIRDAAAWVESRNVAGLKLEVVRIEGRTPVIFFEVPATKAGSTDTICLYGHLDKQPEFNGWRNDLGPWTPKYVDGKLYGRGGADDGYAVYASHRRDSWRLTVARCGAPEDASAWSKPAKRVARGDLLPYVNALRAPDNNRLGDVSAGNLLGFSGAGNYDQLWLTSSLRGMASGVLKVEILTEGVHSGDSQAGLVPSSFRIMRQVLDRLEDSADRAICCPQSFHCESAGRPTWRRANVTASILGDEVYKRFPWAHYDCAGSMARLRCQQRPTRYPGAAKPHLDAYFERHRGRRVSGTARTPAMCCARIPRSNSACVCLRWWTATSAASARAEGACWKTTRPTNAKRYLLARRARRRVWSHWLECAQHSRRGLSRP